MQGRRPSWTRREAATPQAVAARRHPVGMDARAKAKASISPAAALASPAAQAVAARVAAAHAAAVAKAGSSSGVSGLTGQITIGSMAQASPAGGGGSHSKKAPPKKASPTKSAPSGGAKGASASRKAGGSGDKRPASTASSSSKSKKKKTSSGPSSSASSSGGGASGGAVGGSGGGAKAKPSTALHAADCKYHNEICSAMFVNGCAKEVDPGVLRQVDRVVRREMIEVTRAASEMAKARNSRNLTLDDVLFVCRRNRAKIQRIAAFMSAREDAKKRAKGTRSSQTAKLAAGRHKPAWKWELLTDLNDMVKDNRLSVTKGVEADVRAHSQALKRAAEAVNDKNYKEFASAQKESFARESFRVSAQLLLAPRCPLLQPSIRRATCTLRSLARTRGKRRSSEHSRRSDGGSLGLMHGD